MPFSYNFGNNWLHRYVQKLTARTTTTGRRERYPQTCKTILDLRDAAQNETTPAANRKRVSRHRQPAAGGKPSGVGRGRLYDGELSSSTIGSWRKRPQKKIAELTAEVQTSKNSKDVSGRVSEDWLLRIILTEPDVSGCAMAEAYHLVVGSDRNMLHRDSVGRIKAAFLEMWKNLIFSAVQDFIGAQLEAATGASVAARRHPKVCQRFYVNCPG